MTADKTRTEDTEKEYSSKINTIKRLYAKDLLVDGEFESQEAVRECFKRFERLLRTNTVKKYRDVIRWYLTKMNANFDLSDLKIESNPTKSNKMKAYPKKAREYVLRLIKSDLANRRKEKTVEVEFLMLHLICGPCLGYRLVEIEHSRIIDDEMNEDFFVLEVFNGKNSNGRANGLVRRMTVPKYYQGIDLRVSMDRLISISSPSVIISAAKYHSTLRSKIPSEYLYDDKVVCLSSTRHEYVLAARKAKEGIEVSASLGHISIETQKRSYGRSGKGIKQTDDELIDFIFQTKVSQENIKMIEARITKKQNIRKTRLKI